MQLDDGLTGEPIILSFDLLDAFVERLERWGVQGHTEAFEPGLSNDEIDSLLEPTGLRLADEARTLWRWRNGQRDGAFFYTDERFPPLQKAIELRAFQRELAADFDQPERWWPQGFLPIFDSETILAIDCSGSAGARSPVHHMGVDEDREPRIAHPETASIGQLIEWRTTALDRGHGRLDGHVWVIAPELMCPEQRDVI